MFNTQAHGQIDWDIFDDDVRFPEEATHFHGNFQIRPVGANTHHIVNPAFPTAEGLTNELRGMGRQLRALALSPFVGQRLTILGPKEHYTVLERLTELIENGQLAPVIEQTYPLNDMPNAMRQLVAGRARGKLVITVDPTTPTEVVASAVNQ